MNKFKVLPTVLAVSALCMLTSAFAKESSDSAVDSGPYLSQIVATNAQGQLTAVPAYNAPLNSWLSGLIWGNQVPSQAQPVSPNMLKPIYAWPMSYAITQATVNQGPAAAPRVVLAFGHPTTVVQQHSTQPPVLKNQRYVFDWDAARKTTAYAQALSNDFYLSVQGAHLSAPRTQVLNGADCAAQPGAACKQGYAARLYFTVQPVGQAVSDAVVTLNIAQGSPFAQFTVDNRGAQDLTLLLHVNGQLQNTLDPSQSTPVTYSNSNMTLNVAPVLLKTLGPKPVSHAYGLYTPASQQAPTSVAQDLPKNTIQIIAKPGVSHFVVGDLNTQDASYVLGSSDACSSSGQKTVTCAAQGLGQYAMNTITGSDYQWAVDRKQVVTTFTLNTQSLYNEQTQVPVLLALYPHQYSRLSVTKQGQIQQNYDVLNVAGQHDSSPVSLARLTPNNDGRSTIQMSSVYLTAMNQPLRLIAGTSFTTRYPIPTISPAVLPLPKSDTQGVAAVTKAANDWYLEGQKTHFGLDANQGANNIGAVGKRLYQDSNMVALFVALSKETPDQKAAALSLNRANEVAEAVSAALNRYLSEGSDVAFYYDPTLAQMVSKTNLSMLAKATAHPEIYGYFVNAYANVLEQAPALPQGSALSQSLKQLLPAVQMLQNDYAGQCSLDQANEGCNTQHPQAFLRNWDAYAGHTWSTGPLVGHMGPSLQNIGESLNANRGLIQLGTLTHNAAMKNLGLYLYTTEQQANQFYWQDWNAQYRSLHDANTQTPYALTTTPPSLGSFAALVGAGGVGLVAQGTADPYGLLTTSFWPLTSSADDFSAQWLQRLDALRNMRALDATQLSTASKSWSITPTKDNGGYAREGNAEVAPWYTIAHSSYEGVVDELIGNADPVQGLLQFAAWDASRTVYGDKQGHFHILPNLPLGQTIPQAYNNLRALTDQATSTKTNYPVRPENLAWNSSAKALCWNGMSAKEAQKQHLGTITYRAYLFPAPGKVDVVATPLSDGKICTQPIDLKAAQAQAKERGLSFVSAAVIAQSSQGGSSEVATTRLATASYPAPTSQILPDSLTQGSIVILVYPPTNQTVNPTAAGATFVQLNQGTDPTSACQDSLNSFVNSGGNPPTWLAAYYYLYQGSSVYYTGFYSAQNAPSSPAFALQPDTDYAFCALSGYGSGSVQDIFSEASGLATPVKFHTPKGIQPVTNLLFGTPPTSPPPLTGYSLPVSWNAPFDDNSKMTPNDNPVFTYKTVLCPAAAVSESNNQPSCTDANAPTFPSAGSEPSTALSANFNNVLGNQSYQAIVTATEPSYTPPQASIPNPQYSSTAVTTTPFVAATIPLTASDASSMTASAGTPASTTIPVTISWAPFADPNVDASGNPVQVTYEVKAISTDGTNGEYNVDVTGVTGTSTVLNLFLGNVKYTEFDVIATDTLGQTATLVNKTTYTTPPLGLPDPTSVTAVLGAQGAKSIPMTINWAAITDPNQSATVTYKVRTYYQNPPPGSPKGYKEYDVPADTGCNGTQCATTLELPLGNVTYTKVTVEATDDQNQNSKEVQAVPSGFTFPYHTPNTALQAPTGLSASAGDVTTQNGKSVVPMTINWIPSVDNNVGATITYTVTAFAPANSQLNVSSTETLTSPPCTKKACAPLSTTLYLPVGNVTYSHVTITATDTFSQTASADLVTPPFPYTTPKSPLLAPTNATASIGNNALLMPVTWTPAVDNNIGAVVTYTVTAESEDASQNVSVTVTSDSASCTVSECSANLTLKSGSVTYTGATISTADNLGQTVSDVKATGPFPYTTPDSSITGAKNGTATPNYVTGTETLTFEGAYKTEGSSTVYATEYLIQIVGGKNDGYSTSLPCTPNGGSQSHCYVTVLGYGTTYKVTGYYKGATPAESWSAPTLEIQATQTQVATSKK